MKKTIIAGTIAGSILFSDNTLAASYTVKSGDSIWKISKSHNVSVSQLRTWNNLKRDLIYPGQVLTINGTSTGSNTTTSGGSTSLSTYMVVSGDTFSGIAKKYNMSTATLQALNPSIIDINSLRVGQVLTVSEKSNSSSSGSSGTISGDTISSSTSWEKKADAIIATGSKYLGAPYVYGASVTQTSSFDCSSFTMRIFQENGITLPRTSIAQSQVGTSVDLSNIRKGDLVFFDTDYNGVINHVAIAMNSTTILHCQSSFGVSISSLNTYWKPRVVKVTRVL